MSTVKCSEVVDKLPTVSYIYIYTHQVPLGKVLCCSWTWGRDVDGLIPGPIVWPHESTKHHMITLSAVSEFSFSVDLGSLFSWLVSWVWRCFGPKMETWWQQCNNKQCDIRAIYVTLQQHAWVPVEWARTTWTGVCRVSLLRLYYSLPLCLINHWWVFFRVFIWV